MSAAGMYIYAYYSYLLLIGVSCVFQGTTDAEPLGCYGEGAADVSIGCRTAGQRFLIADAQHFGL